MEPQTLSFKYQRVFLPHAVRASVHFAASRPTTKHEYMTRSDETALEATLNTFKFV